MKTLKRWLSDWFPVAALIVALIVMPITILGCNETRVRSWADAHGYEVVSMERWHFRGGPFWRGKGDDILKAQIRRDGVTRDAWFKINLWGVKQRWEDGTSDDN